MRFLSVGRAPSFGDKAFSWTSSLELSATVPQTVGPVLETVIGGQ